MKKRWFFCLFAAVTALCVLGATLLSRDIRARLMPRTAVRQAVLDTADALAQRFEENPVLHIPAVLKRPEQQIRLQFPGGEAKAVIHLNPRTLSGSWKNDRLSLDFYGDPDSIALSSRQLTKNEWFGIVYDRFSEDISQIPLISWILTDSLLSSWEDALETLRSRVMADVDFPELPSFSREELSRLTLALASMKTEVTKTTITVGRAPQKCLRIHCRSGGPMTWLMPQSEIEPEVACTFYLQNGSLLVAQITAETDAQQIYLQFEADGAAGNAPVRFLYRCREGEREEICSAAIETNRSGDMLEERWALSINGWQRNFSYRWDQSTGVGTVTGESGTAAVLFLPQSEGFHLETAAFPQLVGILFPEIPVPAAWEACIMDVQPGTAPLRPDFRTPDVWTAEDLLTLLEGLGSILKIPFP